VIKRDIIICHDADELARKTAEQFVSLAGAAIVRSGRFTVALSGGSTPRASLLGRRALRAAGSCREQLPHGSGSAAVENQHSSHEYSQHGGRKGAARSRNEYEEELRSFFALTLGQMPRFDLVLLGLGEDGHTASLFPGGAALNQNERLVATAYVERLRAHRLTLTLPVINAAAQVTFLIAGQSKRAIVNEILRSDADSFKYPAARVSPSDGQLTWLITADAMGNLPIR
jgi:6-phosphogluconolactonase